jgi:hypothetical protein
MILKVLVISGEPRRKPHELGRTDLRKSGRIVLACNNLLNGALRTKYDLEYGATKQHFRALRSLGTLVVSHRDSPIRRHSGCKGRDLASETCVVLFPSLVSPLM